MVAEQFAVGRAAGDSDEIRPGLPARALGWLFVAGASIGLVSLVLPHSAAADDPGLYSNVALAYAGGLVLLGHGPRLPTWTLHVALVAGGLLITRAVLLSGEPVSFYAGWFVWIGLYAFSFFSRSAAAAHVALAALLFALTLTEAGASSPLPRWLTTVTTLIVAGIFIDKLVRHARDQAERARASAATMQRHAEVAHELAGLSDARTARAALCQAAADVSGADAIALWEPGDDRAELRLSCAHGPAPGRARLQLAGAGGPAQRAFASGAACADGGPAADGAGDRDGSPAARRRLWQPVVSDGVPVALLCFCWDKPPALDDPSLRVLAGLLATQTAVTLERVALFARLEATARTDELTGLPNRRAWEERMPREVTRARRSREPLCVAMLDLDHFKRYNDAAGHEAGDRLLRRVAGAWSSELRAIDVLARYGGDEFALAMPGADRPRAREIVERLRRHTPAGQRFSAGIAEWDGREPAAELLARADAALYDGKRSGRGHTTVAAAPGALAARGAPATRIAPADCAGGQPRRC